MGFNPRFAMWGREEWQGYAPTISDMRRRGWVLTVRCDHCRLEMASSCDLIIRKRGPAWSPWGKSAACRRLHCPGRMRLRAYAPRPNEFIDI